MVYDIIRQTGCFIGAVPILLQREIIEFGDFTLDVSARRLTHAAIPRDRVAIVRRDKRSTP
jgi:hypothetical protein